MYIMNVYLSCIIKTDNNWKQSKRDLQYRWQHGKDRVCWQQGVQERHLEHDPHRGGLYHDGWYHAKVPLLPERPPGQQPGGDRPGRHGRAGKPLLPVWRAVRRGTAGFQPALQVQRQGV